MREACEAVVTKCAALVTNVPASACVSLRYDRSSSSTFGSPSSWQWLTCAIAGVYAGEHSRYDGVGTAGGIGSFWPSTVVGRVAAGSSALTLAKRRTARSSETRSGMPDRRDKCERRIDGLSVIDERISEREMATKERGLEEHGLE